MRLQISDEQLALFRFFFFAVFALDAFLQIAHAPRYGFLDFNVAHYELFGAILPVPDRPMMVGLYTLQCYLGLRLALGRAPRLHYIALAIAFGIGYFISQLNSYQHHFLLFVVLCIVAAFPWPEVRPPLPVAEERPEKRRLLALAQNWPIRLLLVVLSIVYVFAAIAKLDEEWLDGTTMKVLLTGAKDPDQLQIWARDISESLGWRTVSILTILAELTLAVLLHVRRAGAFAFFLGAGMHLAFEFSGLDIGLFSYFMVTLYLLVIPESWLRPFARVRRAMQAAGDQVRARVDGPIRGILVGAVCAVVGVTLVSLLPLPLSAWVFVSIGVLATIDVLSRRELAESGPFPRALSAIFSVGRSVSSRPSGAGLRHLAACLFILVFPSQTDTLKDYSRFWGYNEKLQKNWDQAIYAYEQCTRVSPDYASGHYRLGELYLRQRRFEEAVKSFETVLRLEPDKAAFQAGLARAYFGSGKKSEAVEAARKAVAMGSKDSGLQAIIQQESDAAPR